MPEAVAAEVVAAAGGVAVEAADTARSSAPPALPGGVPHVQEKG
jgi:hypothetical protein